ncbi:MAG: methyltransferase family protein [Bacteroidota bacterium]
MSNLVLWVILPLSVLWLLSETGIALVTYSPRQAKEHDRFSFPIMVGTTMTMVPLGIFLAVRGIGAFPFQHPLFPVLGMALMLAGIAFRWGAILTLKQYFNIHIGIDEDHQLIQHGLYHWIRHPSYTGSLVCFFGMGLAYMNGCSLFLMFVPPLLALVNRMNVEEEVLLKVFGEAYRDYMQRTRRLVPGLY